MPELDEELQEAQQQYNVEALRAGQVREDGGVDMPWLNFTSKPEETVAHEAAEEFTAIMELENEETIATLLHVYCVKYCRDESLPMRLGVIAWKRLGNSERIRKHIQEEFTRYKDSLTEYDLSEEEAQGIRHWLGLR